MSYLGGGYSEIQGNPLLKPEKDYQLSLRYILKSKYVFSFWFNHNKDMSMQTLYQSPEKLLEIYKSLNFDFRQQAVVQVSVPFKVGQWLDSRLTLVGMWLRDKDSDFYDLPFDRRTLAGVAVLNATFKLPVKPDLRLTLNGFCQTGAIQGIYDLPTSGNLDLGLRYAFAGGVQRHLPDGRHRPADTLRPPVGDERLLVLPFGGPLLCLEVRRLSGEEKGRGGHVALQIESLSLQARKNS